MYIYTSFFIHCIIPFISMSYVNHAYCIVSYVSSSMSYYFILVLNHEIHAGKQTAPFNSLAISHCKGSLHAPIPCTPRS